MAAEMHFRAVKNKRREIWLADTIFSAFLLWLADLEWGWEWRGRF